MQTLLVPIQIVKAKTAVFIPKKSCDGHMMSGHMYGAPFVKILYLTDLAQKLLSLRIFSYLCAEIAISTRI